MSSPEAAEPASADGAPAPRPPECVLLPAGKGRARVYWTLDPEKAAETTAAVGEDAQRVVRLFRLPDAEASYADALGQQDFPAPERDELLFEPAQGGYLRAVVGLQDRAGRFSPEMASNTLALPAVEAPAASMVTAPAPAASVATAPRTTAPAKRAPASTASASTPSATTASAGSWGVAPVIAPEAAQAYLSKFRNADGPDEAAADAFARNGHCLPDVPPPGELAARCASAPGLEAVTGAQPQDRVSEPPPQAGASPRDAASAGDPAPAAERAASVGSSTIWPPHAGADVGPGYSATVELAFRGRLAPGFSLTLFGEPVVPLPGGQFYLRRTVTDAASQRALLDLALAQAGAETATPTAAVSAGEGTVMAIEAEVHVSGRLENPNLADALGLGAEVAADGGFQLVRALPQGVLWWSGVALSAGPLAPGDPTPPEAPGVA